DRVRAGVSTRRRDTSPVILSGFVFPGCEQRGSRPICRPSPQGLAWRVLYFSVAYGTDDGRDEKRSVSVPIAVDRGLKSSSRQVSLNQLLRRLTMTKLIAAAAKFAKAEEGATLAEYGLLLALIAVACIGAITALGGQIAAMFNSLSTSI